MSNNGSMAVWCKPRETSCSTAEIHFNYWRLTRQPNFQGKPDSPVRDFAEIGVLLTDPTAVESIHIYLPLILTREDVQDCGPYFGSVDIAQGIFNKPLSSKSVGPPGPRRIELLKQDGTPYCHVHEFPTVGARRQISDEQLEISRCGEGTKLVIPRAPIDETTAGLVKNCPAYFRLRCYVPMMADNPFVSLITPADHHFQSGYEEVEYIDFRLNEARTLPSTIESCMRTDLADKIKFSLVAFLTALPIASDVTVSSEAEHKIRLLEHDIWDNYVKSGIPDGMVVYHWRKNKNGGVDDFSAFVKLRTRRSDKKILATYLLIAFLFGILGNLSANCIQSGLSHFYAASSDVEQLGRDAVKEPPASSFEKEQKNHVGD